MALRLFQEQRHVEVLALHSLDVASSARSALLGGKCPCPTLLRIQLCLAAHCKLVYPASWQLSGTACRERSGKSCAEVAQLLAPAYQIHLVQCPSGMHARAM